MTPRPALPFHAGVAEYERQAGELFDALAARDEAVAWRFKWEHPRFRGQLVTAVRDATLDRSDAQTVIAREYGFADWEHLGAFASAVEHDASVVQFETAVEAVVSGDLEALRQMLRQHPGLVRARSARRHHATLLHYLAANGVEGHRQKTPPAAVDVAKTLLDAGAEVDALADMYDQQCTTMSMLVSSAPPAEAGLQAAIAETLLDYGAALDEGPGTNWTSPLMTALIFGYPDTAQALARRGARVDTLAAAAGLGRLEDVRRLLPGADAAQRQVALALAAQLGHAAVVQWLLDSGEDPNRYNPDGLHSHATPLHQAVSSNRLDVVRLLIARGARLDIADTIYQGTPLDWANFLGRSEIADALRAAAGPRHQHP